MRDTFPDPPAATRFDRLAAHWVYGGALIAPLLLAMLPLLGLDPVATLVWLALPVYMLHQYEEHDADRFRRFANDLLAGRRGLSRADVFWINVAGVWALLVATLWLTIAVDPGWAAIATWLLGLNGLIHLGQAIALRRYNPGLITALVLFLPLAAWLWLQVPAGLPQQILSFAIVLALHGAILARATRHGPAVP